MTWSRWVKPELVAEATRLTWTRDGVLRQVVYQGLRSSPQPKWCRLLQGILRALFHGAGR
jgi:hypothetical protein